MARLICQWRNWFGVASAGKKGQQQQSEIQNQFGWYIYADKPKLAFVGQDQKMSLRPAPQRKIVYMLQTYVDKGFLLEKKQKGRQARGTRRVLTESGSIR